MSPVSIIRNSSDQLTYSTLVPIRFAIKLAISDTVYTSFPPKLNNSFFTFFHVL